MTNKGRSTLALVCLMLAACGGGGDGQVSIGPEAPLAYSNTADTRHSYTPYTSGSHTYAFDRGDVVEIYIGGDVGPREDLRHVLTADNGIEYYMGASRDGVGVGRLTNYGTDLLTRDGTDLLGQSGDGFRPFLQQPKLFLDPDFLEPENNGIRRALYDSILILNDALPPEFQIQIWATRDAAIAYTNEIMVSLESPESISVTCSPTAVACARNYVPFGNYTWSSVLRIPDDLDTTEYMYPRSVIVHELLHALGILGHVDSVEFPDSIMGTAGENIPNLGHIISKIDREVLQIMYMNQRTGLYNDWGEWSDTTFHLVGRSEDEALNFGVALFNGLPQPWVRGIRPDTDLADNAELTGTATWAGSLLGFSGPSPILGNAELEVSLSTLSDADSEQDLRFRDIYFLNRFESDGPDRWFSTRNIDYKVNVTGNVFLNVTGEGYEDGFVTGAFLGPNHEHMGGTVKRTDMLAAFGGSRE